MPICHWTQHAYGTWLPDRPEGFFLHGRGQHEQDDELAAQFRGRQRDGQVRFDDNAQRLLIEALREGCCARRVRLHAVATGASHFHAVLSWADDRVLKAVCAKLKESVTRRLNVELERRPWFTRNASRLQVHDSEHLERLLIEYLPDHPGWKWDERNGLYLARPDRDPPGRSCDRS